MYYRYSVMLFWLSFYCLGLVGAEEEAPAEDKSKRAFYALFCFNKRATPLPAKQGATKEDYERMVEQQVRFIQESLVFTKRSALLASVRAGQSLQFNNTSQSSPLLVRALADLPGDRRSLVTCVDYKNVYADGAPQQLAVTFPDLEKVTLADTNIVLETSADGLSINQENLLVLCGRQANRNTKVHIAAQGFSYAITGDGSILTGRRLRPGNTITDLAGVVAQVQKRESGLCLTFEGSEQDQQEIVLRYAGRTSVEAFLEKSTETAV